MICGVLMGCAVYSLLRVWRAIRAQSTEMKKQACVQPLFERSQRSLTAPPSLILYTKVPLPQERLSSNPNLHKRLKYVHAERFGEKSSLSAALPGLSHSPFARSNTDNARNLSLLYRFILVSSQCGLFSPYQKLVAVSE